MNKKAIIFIIIIILILMVILLIKFHQKSNNKAISNSENINITENIYNDIYMDSPAKDEILKIDPNYNP